MQTPLWLTAHEQVIFNTLPSSLREGWEVHEETLKFNDSTEQRIARMSLMRLHDPKLIAFRDKAQKLSSEELWTLIEKMDLQGVSDDDLSELFFALGPDMLTKFINPMLRAAKTDDDVESIESLLVVRHSLLEAFHS